MYLSKENGDFVKDVLNQPVRSYYDIVNFLLDKASDGFDLVFLFLLCIVKDQLISVFFCKCGFKRFCVSGSPVIL